MHLHYHIPSRRLQPFIRKYLVVETDVPLVNRILPDTSLVIAFRCGGQVNYITDGEVVALPKAVISGLQRSARLIAYEKGTTNILVQFTETGAAAFLREPLHELFAKSLSLENFFSSQSLADLEGQLGNANNIHERICLVDQFLLSKIDSTVQDQLVMNAVSTIRSAAGALSIKELALSLYISQDAFEKRFRKVIGTSPKQFASITRMKHIIDLKKNTPSLTGIAYEGGYFDQPHFINHFRSFTGQTPTEFFKTAPRW